MKYSTRIMALMLLLLNSIQATPNITPYYEIAYKGAQITAGGVAAIGALTLLLVRRNNERIADTALLVGVFSICAASAISQGLEPLDQTNGLSCFWHCMENYA